VALEKPNTPPGLVKKKKGKKKKKKGRRREKKNKKKGEGEEKLVNSMRKGKILLYTKRFSTFQPFLYLSRVILLF
jgi:hypothetical protein